jgi:signal transduction histidine kinase
MPLQPAPRPGAAGPSPAAAADQVETTLFRALGVLRLVVLVYAVVLNVVRFEEFTRPTLVVVLLSVMVAWTAFAIWAYDAPGRRRLPLFVADLAVAVALLLSTPLVQSEAMLDRHASTVPTFWVIPSVLAWAVGRHWSQALAAAGVMAVADLSVRTSAAGRTWGNIFLLLLAAGVVAYSARTLRVAVEMRARAEREAAAIAERVRLSRAVHDGVLQVLALVQRRGTEAGGDLAELGRLAGEQEAALRALVQAHERTVERPLEPGGDVDLLEMLPAAPYTVSGPGRPVPLPSDRAHELAAVVAACLDNVRRHVGADAPAWILVEDLGDSVAVTVRDEGPGIPEGRLAQAAREGRLGVRESIQGRIADLGGEARLVTAAGQGTEWELVVPRG